MTKSPPKAYIGRFAPTPSGPLHFGSLIAALGSYLDAHHHHGKWLIRIEDIDSSRSQKSHTEAILNSLTAHGLNTDAPIRIQSQHQTEYEQTLQKLHPHLYPCNCSRKQWHQHANIGELGYIYPQTCRSTLLTTLTPNDTAIRLTLPDETLAFTDRINGEYRYHLPTQIGDPILRRRDGDMAYALAVVHDDAVQHITHIVRGADLIAATAIQHILQRYLSLPSPSVLHLPLALTPNGDKLSKQNHAPAIDDTTPSDNLLSALRFLGQNTDGMRISDNVATILQTAIKRWNIATIPLTNRIPTDNNRSS